MRRFFSTAAVLLALLGAAAGRGQTPQLNTPAPLVGSATATAVSAGDTALALAAAQRAQELGFSSVAVGLYRGLIEAGRGDRVALTLGLATALLEEGRAAEAETALAGITAPRGAAWQLRAGLAAAAQRKTEAAKAAFAAVRAEELAPGERSWWLLLQGRLADLAGDVARARDFYSQAVAAAASSVGRTRFALFRERARLRTGGPVTEAELEAARKNAERLQGRKAGYDYARVVATMLHAMGRKGEAVAELQRLLLALPAQERDEIDDTRLLLGLVAGAQDGAGRNALGELLRSGSDRDKQRIALKLLADAAVEGVARADYRRRLDELIALQPPHPVREELLVFRAQAALADKNYALAEDDAREVLGKFPGTGLKAHVLTVLAGAAWERQSYRLAADFAAKARAEPAAAPVRAELGVLVAEAWFRAKVFRAAADAYAAALREPPAGVPAGDLMYQRVQAEIEAGAPAEAAKALDALAGAPGFDAENRWRAEWNLARAFQVRDRAGIAAALGRVSRLLDAPGISPSPALLARMQWLQARLALQADQPAEAGRLVEALAGRLDGLAPELRDQIASTSRLLKAEADFALGREQAALDALKKLRADFPRAEATVQSYIVEADHAAAQEKSAEAQALYTKLADTFPEDPRYAPYALFQAALQAERRGQDAEANQRIEDLVKKYPGSDLVFDARLRQGELLRKLNQYPQAQRAYEDLVNNHRSHPHVVLAQLALAECHNAQSAADPASAHAETALGLFEEVRDRVDAGADARIEAGYNVGALLARRGAADKAAEAWWRDVVQAFLLADGTAAARLREPQATGRYWMARTLLELGELFERQEKLEQAKDAWQLVLTQGLPGEATAQAKLARLGVPEAKQ